MYFASVGAMTVREAGPPPPPRGPVPLPAPPPPPPPRGPPGGSPAPRAIASPLPNIYDAEQLEEFAAASETPPLSADELARIADLYEHNFRLPERPDRVGEETAAQRG